jgi:aspartyl-tRNA(Asn)/glutamyl-tRNA(Gln) amidotransferase subunit A
VREAAKVLIDATGLIEVDRHLDLPNLAAQWMMGNLSTLLAELGDRWPRCAPDLTDEVAFGLYLSQALYNLRTAAVAEDLRLQAYAAMAAAFAEVDFVIAATNPDVAPADAPTSNPQEGVIDAALSERSALRGAARSPRCGSRHLRSPSAGNAPRPDPRRFPDLVNMGAHDDREPLRKPGVDPVGAGRWLACRAAGPRPAPRGRVAVRCRARRRTRRTLAAHCAARSHGARMRSRA